MRILNLRLKNLNSLVGEWSIDFTHPDFETNGIFAIVGPTGAGKSTLLDAICLALYGKTPRLDKISKNSNEIMARQTGECYAEVTIETVSGRYRCFWAQHRSHKKAGGELQQAQREVVDATTGQVLENHLSRVEDKVEEITGMDFQRFTRSMLLAQGSFDAFLKASPSERAPILEQITGTELYSKISIGIFERTKSEVKKLEDVQRELAGIDLLADDAEHNLIQELQEKNAECTQHAERLKKLHEQKTWRSDTDRAASEMQKLQSKWELYKQEEQAGLLDLNKLDLALKALTFEGDYRDFCSLQNKQKEELIALAHEHSKKQLLEKERIHCLKQLLIGLQENYAKDTQRLKESIQLFEDRLAVFRKQESSLQQRRERLDETIEALTTQHAQHSHMQFFEEERKQLSDDAPCPLCGSLVHPYAQGNRPDLNGLLLLLASAKEEKRTLEQSNLVLAKELSQIETELRHTRECLHEEQKRQEESIERIAPEIALLLMEQERLEQDGEATEKCANTCLNETQADINVLRDAYKRTQHRLESIEARIEELKKGTEGRLLLLQSDEQNFIAQINTIGFSDIESFRKASLNYEERQKLAQIKQGLEIKKTELLAEKKAAEKRFAELMQEAKTEETLLGLEKQIHDFTKRYEESKARALYVHMILSENAKKVQTAAHLQEKMILQQSETEIWKALCSLAGAADGKKLRDVAQRMTLEMMIAQANLQLMKMSDRYLLKQSRLFPLELEVVDNYQAGEERSVKNLSGGEGFIVSLALALGLSQMSSRKVRVDTLFLDEGFGTLDERALEVALDTLADLQQDGKMIGLISHVAVLKERIATQISVQPISGGRSRIEGPGCCKVAVLI